MNGGTTATHRRPTWKPGWLLALSVLAGGEALMAQDGFTFPQGEAPRLFLPGFTEEADYDKLLIGQIYWYDFTRCLPAGPCEDGSGNLVAHFGTGHLQVGHPTNWWGGAFSGFQTSGTCGICSSVQDDWGFQVGEPDFLVKPSWKPGLRRLRVAMQPGPAGGQTYSAERQVRLVYPDVVDLGVKKFDVLDEEDLCLGGEFTSRCRVYNWGELDATAAVVEIIAASDKQMTTDVVVLDTIPLAQTVPAGELTGLLVEHTATLPPDLAGVRYLAARVFWDPGDPDPPPQGTAAHKQTAADKVSLLADFKFVGDGLEWELPSGSPALVYPGQQCTLRYRARNKGRVDTAPDSALLVQLKKSASPWQTIAQIPVPEPIPCHSGEFVSGTLSFVMPGDDPEDPLGSHPYVQVGKKRSVRLVFVNGGPSPDPGVPAGLVDETKLGNNKSKAKLVKFVPVPEVDLALVRGAWLPEGRSWESQPGDPGNHVAVTATLQEGGPARPIRLRLLEVSAYPGVCMNFGASSDGDYNAPDLGFRKEPGHNDGFHEPSEAGLSIETEGAVDEAVVLVTAYDYAARGQLEAIALDELGEPIGEPTTVWLPADDNQNLISDDWPGDVYPELPGDGVSDPGWDEDHDPLPWGLTEPPGVSLSVGTDGDGLTRFEEYRGFMVIVDEAASPPAVDHQRLTPERRELFVHQENPNHTLLDKLLPLLDYLVVYPITAGQMNGALFDRDGIGAPPNQGLVNPASGPRVVNFNSPGGALHKVDQHGLWLRLMDDSTGAFMAAEGWWGFGHFLDDNPSVSPLVVGGAGQNTPPWGMGRLDVYLDNITADCGPINELHFAWDASQGVVADSNYGNRLDSLISETTCHELSHALSVQHHANWEYASATEAPAGYPWYPGPGAVNPYAYPVEQYILDDDLPLWSRAMYGREDYLFVYFHDMGVRRCWMRYPIAEIYAAVSGDQDRDGMVDPYVSDPIESTDHDWSQTVSVREALCTGAEEYGGPEPLEWPDELWTEFASDACLGQLVIDDLDEVP